jgi:hypothetical protein
MGAVLIVNPRTPVQKQDRGSIDEKARRLVITAYRRAYRTRSQMPLEAALNSYIAKYPYMGRDLAGYTLAHIISTAGF